MSTGLLVLVWLAGEVDWAKNNTRNGLYIFVICSYHGIFQFTFPVRSESHDCFREQPNRIFHH